MNVEQKRRELFEEFWCKTRGYIPARDGEEYATPVSDYCWEGFNAALDAVEIVLPFEACNGMMNGDRVRAAIESTGLGLKVKP